MELIYLYIAFATATAVIGYLWLIVPAMAKLAVLNPQSEFVTSRFSRFQLTLVLEILLFLVAPLIVLIAFRKVYSQNFIDALAMDLAKH